MTGRARFAIASGLADGLRPCEPRPALPAGYAARMPSTVADLLGSAGLALGGTVRWDESLPQDGPGDYIVSLTEDPHSTAGARSAAPIDLERVEHLLRVRPELSLDARRPVAAEVAARLQAFWLPDEVVLYVGLAGTSVRERVARYYDSPLGARQPHAGGWWLKTLSVLDGLWVHYAATTAEAAAEETMLWEFATAISPSSRQALHDQVLTAPFANVRTHSRAIKGHGFRKATGDLRAGGSSRRTRAGSGRASTDAVAAIAVGRGPSQPSQKVSPKDLAAGQVRVPRRTKALLPAGRGEVQVRVRGQVLHAHWDPRNGPDRERSGMVSFGKGQLAGLVQAGEVLAVRTEDGDIVASLT
jgi:hypothetical protein